MKKSLTATLMLFTFLIMFSFSFTAMAEEPDTYVVPLQPETEFEDEERGHRVPVRPIICQITSTGLQMSIPTTDIISYEVWNESDDLCLASYMDEMDFVRFIYTLHGEYILRIITEEHSYIGYIFIQ